MPDKGPEEEDANAPSPGELRSTESRQRGRRAAMTPEQRRLLGPARTLYDQPDNPAETPKTSEFAEEGRKITAAGRPARERKPDLKRATWKPERALEMQNIALLLGALLLLGITFYVGKRYEYWKYAIVSRSHAKVLEAEANKFPGVSAEELIDQALVAERLGNWQEAATRYIGAKFKNLSLPGLLFRAGKLYYDHSAFDGADKLFERAIALGENVDAANYYRGMIAVGRDDFPAAERFFEAASNAAPFNADYLYSWAEALRKDRQPKSAITYYQKAALCATEQQALVCRFKARMAMVEAGDIEQLQKELEKEENKGPLSVDWLITAAALQIHAGDIENAVRTVKQARDSDQSQFWGAFAACVGDRLFSSASRNHPDLAQACKMSPSSSPPPLH